MAGIYHATAVMHSINRGNNQPPTPKSSALSKIFPERVWNKPQDSTHTLELQGRMTTLAQKRFVAAKEALDAELVIDVTDPTDKSTITIESALNAFDRLSNEIYKAIQNNTDLRITYNNLNGEVGVHILTSEQVAALCSVVNAGPIGKLADICREIVQELKNAEVNEVSPKKMQALRQKVNHAVKTYQHHPRINQNGFVNSVHAPFIQFLQALSYQLNTQAEGMQVIEEIGSDVLQQCCNAELKDDQTVTPSEISEWTEDIFKKMEADKWDTTAGYLIWALKNIAKAFLAFIDNHISGANKLYNSHMLGNANMWIGDFLINGLKIRFNLGPSPTTDSLFEAQLEWQKMHNEAHIQHTLECTDKKGEKARLEEMRDLAKSQDQFQLMGTPLDGDIAKGKKSFKGIASVADFHKRLGETLVGSAQIPDKIEEYTGFANPVLSKEQITETVKASREAFEILLPDSENDFKGASDEQNERLCKAMLLGFTGFFVIKTLLTLGDKLQEKSEGEAIAYVKATMGQACKQDVDRGPIVNAITIAFVQLIKNGELKGKDAKQIIGMVLMRALMVDGRLMHKGRLEALLDLLNLIGHDDTKLKAFVAKLQEFAGKADGDESPIAFIPSNSDVASEESAAPSPQEKATTDSEESV